MIKAGNYWLDVLTKERNIRKEIESTVRKSIGRKFSNYTEMTICIKDEIRVQLENYGVEQNMGIFNLEYDVDLKYDSNFVLTGFEIKFVYLNEDIW
jgi:hypothetical protein